jgi:hypothetical protein
LEQFLHLIELPAQSLEIPFFLANLQKSPGILSGDR